MHREYLLAANAVGNPADGDGLPNAAVLAGNDGALEHLNSLAVPSVIFWCTRTVSPTRISGSSGFMYWLVSAFIKSIVMFSFQ